MVIFRKLKRPLCGLALLLALPAWSAEAPAHLTLVRSLLGNLSAGASHYQHQSQITWPDSGKATAYTDCSGLVNGLLSRTQPKLLASLRSRAGREPQAIHYFQAVAENQGFQAVTRVQNLQPGDLIVIRNPPEDDDTGHIMIVDEAPVESGGSSPPKVPGTYQWQVKVIDSSKSAHGPRDSRALPGGNANGVGRGTIRLYADLNGVPLGYTWSTLPVSDYIPQASKALLMGRIQAQP